jgi:hypothetical protein
MPSVFLLDENKGLHQEGRTDMNKKIKDEFIRFMEENDMLEEFMSVLWESREMTLREYLSIDDRADTIISGAFLWANRDDADVWDLLNEKWRQRLNNIT